jgi:hypothetical protein
MDEFMRSILWRQLGSAIDMFGQAIEACPDKLWRVSMWPVRSGQAELSEFWYIAFHTLFWLDLYLSGAVEGFTPPEPFTLDELDPAGATPSKPYSKVELKAYLELDRMKCRQTIESMTDEKAWHICKFPWGEIPFVELLLDNMRHVQEHTAQLNMILGQKIDYDPGWVASSKITD